MNQHMLNMNHTIGKRPFNRPEPVDDALQVGPGGVSGEVDVAHHLGRIDDAPGQDAG
jgi:hypothetical protein